MAGRKRFDVEAALDRAMLTFWEHGYDGASLDVLTREMGVGRSSFYATFGSKDQLFRAALDRYAARGDGRAPATIRAYYEAMLARMLDPAVPGGCLVTQSAALATELDPASRRKVTDLLDHQRHLVADVLRRAGIPENRVAALAEYVVAVRQSLAVLHRSGSGEPALRAVIDLACETVSAARN